MEDENKQPEKLSKLPMAALWLDIAAVLSFFVGWGCWYTVVLIPLGLILFLATIMLPFVAVVVGISALCLGKKNIGTRGIIISSIAIATPVIFVLVMVILFSTGVAVIHWM